MQIGELAVGMSAESAKTITEADVGSYAGVVGDLEPGSLYRSFALLFGPLRGLIAHAERFIEGHEEQQLQLMERAAGVGDRAPIRASEAFPLHVAPPFNPPSSASAVSVVQRSAPSAVLAVDAAPNRPPGHSIPNR